MDNSYNILINLQSGTAQSTGQPAIERWISDAGLNIKNLCFSASEDLEEQLTKFMNTGTNLLIGGGDGTLTSAAKSCLKHRKPFGIIPLGTMNLMAKDLGIPLPPQEALNAYAGNPVIKSMDVGFVNNEVFLCNASLGTIPASIPVRENQRSRGEALIAPRLALFVMDRLDEINHRPYAMHLGIRKIKIKTPMLVVSNNCYKDTGYAHEHSFTRESLTGNILGIYSSHPQSFWEKIRFFLRLSRGGWKKDPVVKEWRSKKVKIVSGNDTELVSLDGENKTLEMPLSFKIEHNALQVLVPAQRPNSNNT